MKRFMTAGFVALLGCQPQAPDTQVRAQPQVAATPELAGERLLIAAGPITLGYTPENFGNYAGPWKVNERPSRVEELEAFVIDSHEVTAQAWVEFLQQVGGLMAWHPLQPVLHSDGHFEVIGDAWAPARAVNWHEARAYCRWLGLDLPTEAQWERAAHGPGIEPTIYPWGDTGLTCDHANVARSRSPCHPDVLRVASLPAGDSPEGVHDMIGNVAEWTLDEYKDASDAPGDKFRTVRGGSYFEATTRSRNHSRGPAVADYRSVALGFRCAGPADAVYAGKPHPGADTGWPDEVIATGLLGVRQLLLRSEGIFWGPTSDGRLLEIDMSSGAVTELGQDLPTGRWVQMDGEVFSHSADTLFRIAQDGASAEVVLSNRFDLKDLTAAGDTLYFTERGLPGRRLLQWQPGGMPENIATINALGASVAAFGDDIWVGVYRDAYRGESAEDPGRETGYYKLEDGALTLAAATDLSPRWLLPTADALYAIANDGAGVIETLEPSGRKIRHGYAASSPRALVYTPQALYWGGAPGLYRRVLPDGRPETLRLDVSPSDMIVIEGTLWFIEGITGTLRKVDL